MVHFARNYVAEFNPVPPLPISHLREHAQRAAQSLPCDARFVDYLGVLINNEIWRESFAGVPFERRLLLLPKCLRSQDKCRARFDEFGLLCRQCGLCSIQDLQTEAESLGYAVLVAEGAGVVTSMIQSGKIEAIVGVSCLNVLERAFPYMEAAAIPGVAVPLLQDDCANTTVDMDWVWDFLHLTRNDESRRLDLGALRDRIGEWFTPDRLAEIMGEAEGATEIMARDWLARAGKRWRPFLTVAAYQAMRDNPNAPPPEDLRKVAIAVECFHKASLIHDDIEDGDTERYGEQTLHTEHGIPVALNVGDLLIGEGYRLIGACEASALQKTRMLLVAAEGQRQLCQGQGAELFWARSPRPLTTAEVLEIFRRKTAPAFEVALCLGAIYADSEAHQAAATTLIAFSESLGIAYQIRDDLNDLFSGNGSDDIRGLRPSLLLALAYESAAPEDRSALQSIWRREMPAGMTWEEIVSIFSRSKADVQARALQETYREQAVRSLKELANPSLKGLLRRIVGKIFTEVEIEGWCREFEVGQVAKPEMAPEAAPHVAQERRLV